MASTASEARTRVRVVDRSRRVSCGHHVQAGQTIVSRNRKSWVCAGCADRYPVHVAGQRPRRGAATVPDVLADEAAR